MMLTTTPYTNLENKRTELLNRGFYVSDIRIPEGGYYRMFEARSDEGIDYELIENTHGEVEVYCGLKRVWL